MAKVFVSYSHDDQNHKNWVRELAENLRALGIDASLDQWDLALGGDLVGYMSAGIDGADKVLMICTPAYVAKANEGRGGVGYERLIISKGVYENIATTKFIPVIRGAAASLPTFMGERLYVDFRSDDDYASRLAELARAILTEPIHAKPALGESRGAPEHTEDVSDGDAMHWLNSASALPRPSVSVITASIQVPRPSLLDLGFKGVYWRLANPERYCHHFLVWRKQELSRHKQRFAAINADAKRARAQLDELLKKGDEWHTRARLADAEGRQDLAEQARKHALDAQREVEEFRRASEDMDGVALTERIKLMAEDKFIHHTIAIALKQIHTIAWSDHTRARAEYLKLGDVLAFADWPRIPPAA